MVTLSVVIPVYNGAEYIEETVGTILKNQTDNLELILVNDGSKDNSQEICERIQANDNRVKLFVKSNGGIADARNFGIKKATGNYLAFVDQDDVADIEVMLDVVKRCNDTNSDIGIFSTQYIWKDHTSDCDRIEENKIIDENKIFEELLWPMVYPTAEEKIASYIGHVWAGVYRREYVINNNILFQKMITIEDDYLFVFESLLNAKRVLTCSATGYYWTVNPKSTTYNPQYIENMFEKCQKYYDYIFQKLMIKQDFTTVYIEAYKKMCTQLTAVRFVINAGIYKNKNKFKSWIQLKKYFDDKDKKKMMNKPYLGAGASRKSAYLIFELLSKRMYAFAIVFSSFVGWSNRSKALWRTKNGKAD